MGDCCSAVPSNKHLCPVNQQSYMQVLYSTVLQHIKHPWKNKITEQHYYFCSDSSCDVVYFGEDDSVIKKSELRTLVGIKEPTRQDALVCYCLDITKAQAINTIDLKQYVIDKTKNNLCSCESHNPSGRCCLKDFL